MRDIANTGSRMGTPHATSELRSSKRAGRPRNPITPDSTYVQTWSEYHPPPLFVSGDIERTLRGWFPWDPIGLFALPRLHRPAIIHTLNVSVRFGNKRGNECGSRCTVEDRCGDPVDDNEATERGDLCQQEALPAG